MTPVLVCLAGGFGAVARHLLDSRIATPHAWLGTLLINVTGSVLMGLAIRFGGPEVVAVAGVGFCGGFTTFSTACWQAVRLLGGWRGLGYAVGTAVACVGVVAAVSA